MPSSFFNYFASLIFFGNTTVIKEFSPLYFALVPLEKNYLNHSEKHTSVIRLSGRREHAHCIEVQREIFVVDDLKSTYACGGQPFPQSANSRG